MAGFVTPTHALLLLAAVAAFFILGRMTRGDAGDAAAAHGRRVRRGLRGLRPRLRWPTRREAHAGWLVASVLVAFAFTRGIAVPVFLFVFLVLWLSGFMVLARLYR